jgi:hypothetical protein
MNGIKQKNLRPHGGELFSASLSELRNQGAPVLPTLERMILSIDEERELMLEAKTKSSQAFGQVLIFSIISSIFRISNLFFIAESCTI